MIQTAFFGGAFDSVTNAHVMIALAAAQRAEKVLVTPSGARPDKPAVNDTDAVDRAAMLDLAFQGSPSNVVVNLSDLDRPKAITSFEVDELYRERGGVTHVIGGDLVSSVNGQPPAIFGWYRGQELWQQARFLVFTRPGYPLDRSSLPQHCEVVELDMEQSSTEVRTLCLLHQPFEHLVPVSVSHYIRQHGLYRRTPPNSVQNFRLDESKKLFVYPTDAAQRFPEYVEAVEPWRVNRVELATAMLVMSGDGGMIQAVRDYWRARLPFLGINLGHVGFLSHRLEPEQIEGFLRQDFLLHRCPMLNVTVTSLDGTVSNHIAFQDAYVKGVPRGDSDTTAWIEIIMGQFAEPRHMMADGAIICAAQGSTAYARSAGGHPFSLGTPGLLVVGNNISQPLFWKEQMVSLDAEVTFNNLDPNPASPYARPLYGFVDGRNLGPVKSLTVKKSGMAAAHLLMDPAWPLDRRMRELVNMPRFIIKV